MVSQNLHFASECLQDCLHNAYSKEESYADFATEWHVQFPNGPLWQKQNSNVQDKVDTRAGKIIGPRINAVATARQILVPGIFSWDAAKNTNAKSRNVKTKVDGYQDVADPPKGVPGLWWNKNMTPFLKNGHLHRPNRYIVETAGNIDILCYGNLIAS